jgi:hypothetical protein
MVRFRVFAVALEALRADLVVGLLITYQFKVLYTYPVLAETAFR